MSGAHGEAWELDLALAQAPVLAERVAAAAVAAGLPERRRPFVELAVEETLANLWHHVYGRRPGPVRVTLRREGALLRIAISDEGPAFDPTAAPPSDGSLAGEERPLGGWGLQLIRAAADELHYERQNDRNVLSLVYRVG